MICARNPHKSIVGAAVGFAVPLRHRAVWTPVARFRAVPVRVPDDAPASLPIGMAIDADQPADRPFADTAVVQRDAG